MDIISVMNDKALKGTKKSAAIKKLIQNIIIYFEKLKNKKILYQGINLINLLFYLIILIFYILLCTH